MFAPEQGFSAPAAGPSLLGSISPLSRRCELASLGDGPGSNRSSRRQSAPVERESRRQGRGLVAPAVAVLRAPPPSHGHGAHLGTQENWSVWSRTLVALPFSCKIILLRSQVEGAGEATSGRNIFLRVFSASLSLNINAQSLATLGELLCPFMQTGN